MPQEWIKKHKAWIKSHLTRKLIENQKLIACQKPNEHIEVRSIEAKEMSLEVAFMLTACYFVKISIKIVSEHKECRSEDSATERDFNLVVKFSPEVDPELYENFSMQYMFSNEIVTYELIVPKLKCLSNSPK